MAKTKPEKKKLKEEENEDPGFIDVNMEMSNIYIWGTIDHNMAMSFLNILHRLDYGGPHDTPITIYIHSTGGFMISSLIMVHAMRTCRRPIRTIACGYAMSAACLISAAGDLGERYAFPDALYMLHEPSTTVEGTLAVIKEMQEDVKEHNNRLIDLLHEFTGKTKAGIKKDIAKDYYVSASKAIKYGKHGLVDGIWPKEEV